MKNYDDFDLDLKLDKASDNGVGTNATGNVCATIIELSIAYCERFSKAVDCFSKNVDCSDTRSACTPCTSGYQYEEPNAVVNC